MGRNAVGIGARISGGSDTGAAFACTCGLYPSISSHVCCSVAAGVEVCLGKSSLGGTLHPESVPGMALESTGGMGSAESTEKLDSDLAQEAASIEAASMVVTSWEAKGWGVDGAVDGAVDGSDGGCDGAEDEMKPGMEVERKVGSGESSSMRMGGSAGSQDRVGMVDTEPNESGVSCVSSGSS